MGFGPFTEQGGVNRETWNACSIATSVADSSSLRAKSIRTSEDRIFYKKDQEKAHKPENNWPEQD